MAANPVLSPLRPWQEIARELARETNQKKIEALSTELTAALDRANPHSAYQILPKRPQENS